MTGDAVAISMITTVMDHVESILTSIWSPIVLGMFWFALLSLFLHFRK